MALGDPVRGEPGELVGRPLIAVDAASEFRLGSDQRLITESPFVIVIDHHHDNTRFGTVNWSAPRPPRRARCCETSSPSLGCR